MKQRLSYIVTFLILSAFVGVAQAPVNENDSIIVSLLHCGPGSEIYELEGHEGMRFRIPGKMDVTVNWGLFDFDTPNFAYRFTKGETDYRVGMTPTDYFFNNYRNDGRSVSESVLNLNREEANRLFRLVAENLRPENATYRYNYVKDNCATRPIRLIERATGGRIVFPVAELTADDHTFREIMRRHHRNYPWYQFGIDLALGSGIDYELENSEKIFAPTVLEKMIPGATINGRILSERTTTIIAERDNGGIQGPTPWYLSPLTFSFFVLIAGIVCSVNDLRLNKITRWFDTVYFSLVSIAGLLLTFLIFVSVHEATSPNFLYLWLNPLALIGVIGSVIKRITSLVMCYQIVNFVASIALIVIGLLSVQSLNGAFYPLIITGLLRSITYIHYSIKCRKRINC